MGFRFITTDSTKDDSEVWIFSIVKYTIVIIIRDMISIKLVIVSKVIAENAKLNLNNYM